MWARLISVVEEQAQALLRTAFGSVVREAGDLSAGVYNVQGEMLAQAVTGTPGHVNTMAMGVSHLLERLPLYSMKPSYKIAGFFFTDKVNLDRNDTFL